MHGAGRTAPSYKQNIRPGYAGLRKVFNTLGVLSHDDSTEDTMKCARPITMFSQIIY